MAYYIFIQDNRINGVGQCKQLTRDVTNVEIKEDFYHTFLEYPDMYIWNGEDVVLDPDYEAKCLQKEAKRLAELKLTKREVFLALYKDLGITPEEIKSGITDPSALIEIEYANEYYRGNSLIDMIGASLGYTKEELDYLFENKEFPPKKEVENVGMVS